MQPRDGVILYQQTEKDTAVEIQDINIVDPISAFYIEVECTNGATSNKGNFISDIITKVEVVDGAEVLHSLNFSELEALYFYKTGKMPVMFPSEWGGGLQRHGVYLLFGRYLWDPLYNFDPTKYRNPQVKITFNKAAIRAAGVAGFADADNIKLTLVAKIMQGVPAAAQFLMAKEIDSFTSAALGDKRIDLPVDYPYAMLLIRAYQQGYDIDETISGLKITCDTDKYIPLDRKVKQLDAEVQAAFGLCELKHDVFASDADIVRLLVNKEPMLAFYNWETPLNVFANICWAWSGQFAPALRLHDGTVYGTDCKLNMVEKGHALHATLPVFFGRPWVPEEYFNAPGYKKIEAVFTQGTASSTVQIVTVQPRPNRPLG